jgi:hypothetical protein
MARSHLLIAFLLLVTVAPPRHAAAASDFAGMSISELGAGFVNDANVQFVELRLDAGGQTNLANTRLTAFDKDGVATLLLLTPNGVANGASGRHVLYATTDFQTATGVAPDFVIPPGVVSPKGMICWGAPGSDSPPDPSSWDLAKPESYTDCVAYGGYGGTTRPSSGAPTTLGPGDGTQSLTRDKNTSTAGNNATDFVLAAPNVCNNADQCTTLAPSATPTPLPIATPGKAQLACRRAILKAGTKFAAADVRARVTCETARVKGKVTGPCPDAKATQKIAAADAKRTKAIVKACGALPPGDTGFGAACSGYTGACTAAIATTADVSACVDCGARRASTELTSAVYGAPPDPTLLKCQLALGATTTGYYRAVAALLTKCEDTVARGKLAGPCPDVKTAGKIAAKTSKLAATLCKACGGPDKLCGGTGDASPAALGLTTCPARTVPGGTVCGNIVIGELSDVVNCAECLARFESTCATALFARPGTMPLACTAP